MLTADTFTAVFTCLSEDGVMLTVSVLRFIAVTSKKCYWITLCRLPAKCENPTGTVGIDYCPVGVFHCYLRNPAPSKKPGLISYDIIS